MMRNRHKDAYLTQIINSQHLVVLLNIIIWQSHGGKINEGDLVLGDVPHQHHPGCRDVWDDGMFAIMWEDKLQREGINWGWISCAHIMSLIEGRLSMSKNMEEILTVRGFSQRGALTFPLWLEIFRTALFHQRRICFNWKKNSHVISSYCTLWFPARVKVRQPILNETCLMMEWQIICWHKSSLIMEGIWGRI